MKLGRVLTQFLLALLPAQCAARVLGGKPNDFIIAERAPLQDIVRKDHELFGKSVM
jgi:hypothetical protein